MFKHLSSKLSWKEKWHRGLTPRLLAGKFEGYYEPRNEAVFQVPDWLSSQCHGIMESTPPGSRCLKCCSISNELLGFWRVFCSLSLDIYYYRWSQDPFVQGSYSEPYVGFTSEDFTKLGQNLGRLYFAGEATSEEWYGYIQGAYLSGEEKGKMIACQIHPDENECKAPEKKEPKSEAAFNVRSVPGILLLSLLCSRLWM